MNFKICTVLHPHQSCIEHFVTFAIAGFKRALPLYAPLHIVTTLVVQLAKLTSKVQETVKRAGSLTNLRKSFSIDDFIGAEKPSQETAEHQAPLAPSQELSHSERSRNQVQGKQMLDKMLEIFNRFITKTLQVLTKRRILKVTSYILSLIRRIVFNIGRSSVFLGVYCSGTRQPSRSVLTH